MFIVALNKLVSAIRVAVEISECKIDITNETRDISSEYRIEKELTGWRSLKRAKEERGW